MTRPHIAHAWVGARCVLCLLVGPFAALADDTSKGVLLGGLSSSPTTSLKATAAQLRLEGDAVVLRLSLRRRTANATLSLQGPRFGWLGAGEPYPDRHFPELRARLDGVELTLQPDFAAFAGRRDITASLKALAFDPFVIATTPPLVDAPSDSDRTAFKRLIDTGAVASADGQYLARWQARRHVKLDIGDTTTPVVTLSFNARPAFELVGLDSAASRLRLRAYCITPTALRKRLAEAGHRGAAVVARSYSVAVGVDSRPPPSLAVSADAPNAVFCGADGQPVFGGTGEVPARVGPGGIFRLLRLDPPG